MLAALLVPLAQGDGAYTLRLSAALAITAGLLMVVGGLTRLGFIVNFFARPKLYMRRFGQAMGLGEKIGTENIFLSVRSAVESVLERDAQQAGIPQDSGDAGGAP